MHNVAKKVFLLPVQAYKKLLSPLMSQKCKFYPSCSTYFISAVSKKGIIKGSALGAFRVLRCNPFSLGGVDEI